MPASPRASSCRRCSTVRAYRRMSSARGAPAHARGMATAGGWSVSVRASRRPPSFSGFARVRQKRRSWRVERSAYGLCALTLGVTVGCGNRYFSARAHGSTAKDGGKSRRRVTAAASSSLEDNEGGDPFDPFTTVPAEDWEVDWEADDGGDGMADVWLGSDDDDEQDSKAAPEQKRRHTRVMTQAVQTGRRVKQDTLCIGYAVTYCLMCAVHVLVCVCAGQLSCVYIYICGRVQLWRDDHRGRRQAGPRGAWRRDQGAHLQHQGLEAGLVQDGQVGEVRAAPQDVVPAVRAAARRRRERGVGGVSRRARGGFPQPADETEVAARAGAAGGRRHGLRG